MSNRSGHHLPSSGSPIHSLKGVLETASVSQRNQLPVKNPVGEHPQSHHHT